jgi:hypothetical protein
VVLNDETYIPSIEEQGDRIKIIVGRIGNEDFLKSVVLDDSLAGILILMDSAFMKPGRESGHEAAEILLRIREMRNKHMKKMH